MTYAYTATERKRVSFGKIPEAMELPNLISVQRESFERFKDEGLREAFKESSPIQSQNHVLEVTFGEHQFGDPAHTVEECREKDMTYQAPLLTDVRLTNKETGEIKEQLVFMGDFPMMTDQGTFIINGTERIVVSQLVRSPGVYYGKEIDLKTDLPLLTSTVIPYRGAWLEYEIDSNDVIWVRVDRARKLPVTSRFAIGDVVLEMTQIGKECHNDCVIKQQTGECIMPHEGVFARVLTGGEIHVGDEVTLLPAPENPPLRAAVITLSDKGSRGEREDKSGPLIVEMLTAAGYVVEETMILPDEAKALKAQLIRLADGRQVNLILTTGGTGFSPRDITPEATYAVADRSAPGIAEAMRYHSLSITPRGMLSRAASVLRGKTLIVNLPGSPKAVKENLEYILPSLGHGVRIAAGLDGECARK